MSKSSVTTRPAAQPACPDATNDDPPQDLIGRNAICQGALHPG
jgi:hypothetical protein